MRAKEKKKTPVAKFFFFLSLSPPLSLSGGGGREVAESLAPLKIITFHAEMTGGRFSSALCVSEIKRGLTEAAGRHGCCFHHAVLFSQLSQSAATLDDAPTVGEDDGRKKKIGGKPVAQVLIKDQRWFGLEA